VVQTLLSHSVRVETLPAVEQLFKFIAPLVEEGAAEEEPDDEVGVGWGRGGGVGGEVQREVGGRPRRSPMMRWGGDRLRQITCVY
jgi:hypothetical protein